MSFLNDLSISNLIKCGYDEPLVMGAEPILVTGKVKEGDFIVTSNIEGHGKAIKWYHFLFKKCGRIIGQALESSVGESSVIKAFVRKL